MKTDAEKALDIALELASILSDSLGATKGIPCNYALRDTLNNAFRGTQNASWGVKFTEKHAPADGPITKAGREMILAVIRSVRDGKAGSRNILACKLEDDLGL